MHISKMLILAITLTTWLALRGAVSIAHAQTQPASETGQLDFGLEGLSIPPARIVSGHTARTAELLGEAYRRLDPLVWKRARYVAELGRIGLTAGSPAVAEAMKDPSPQVRAEAARSAAAIGDAALLGDVEKLLGDADPDVRREAVLAGAALVRAGGKPTTPAIERGLADGQPMVIGAAIEAAWTPDDAVRIAAKLSSLPADLQPEAALAVGPLKAARQSAALLPLLDSNDVVARAAAVAALGDIGDASRLDAVVAKLADAHPTVRREAVGAMGKLAAGGDKAGEREKRALAMLADADPTVREAAARVLTPAPSPQAVAAFLPQLGVGYAPLHGAVREALSHPADDATKRAVIDAVVAMLGNADPRRREDASFVLGRLRSNAGADAHVAMLRWDKDAATKTDWPLVAQAAESLGLIGGAGATGGLMALASAAPQALPPALPPPARSPQRDAMAATMSNAVIALARLRHGPALKEAVRILQLEPASCTPRLRAAAAFAVGVLAPEGKSPPVNLFGIVDSIDEDHLTKVEAVKALGNLRYAAAAERLAALAGSGPSPDLRWVAHWAYERCSGKSIDYVPPTELREPPVSVTDLAR
jgi:HEAT repeats